MRADVSIHHGNAAVAVSIRAYRGSHVSIVPVAKLSPKNEQGGQADHHERSEDMPREVDDAGQGGEDGREGVQRERGRPISVVRPGGKRRKVAGKRCTHMVMQAGLHKEVERGGGAQTLPLTPTHFPGLHPVSNMFT